VSARLYKLNNPWHIGWWGLIVSGGAGMTTLLFPVCCGLSALRYL